MVTHQISGVMEYTIIFEVKIKKMIAQVNKYISEGWEPLGGISLTTSNTVLKGERVVVTSYCQAMTKGK